MDVTVGTIVRFIIIVTTTTTTTTTTTMIERSIPVIRFFVE